MKEKIRDRQKNSSYPEIRVKRVRVNGFQLYFSRNTRYLMTSFGPEYEVWLSVKVNPNGLLKRMVENFKK